MATLDISVIIPFKDKSDMTLAGVRSLLKNGPEVTEILLVSNNSSETELEKIRAAIAYIPNAKLLIYDHPFNYQKINNWAASQAKGELLLYLNNDIEFTKKSM